MSKAEHLQWLDPTADRAISIADGGSERNNFARRHLSRGGITPVSLQAHIEGKIHALRQALAAGEINRADYRLQIDPLRSARRQMREGGG